MMKMATGEGFPPPAGCRNGSREVFGGYRGLRQRNSRSIFFFDVFRVYGIYRRNKSVRGATRCPRGWGRAHRGRARLPASWPPRSFLDFNSKSPGSRSFQKSRSRRFHSVWTPFDIPFLRNTETRRKTETGTGLWVNRLVPKII